jgi:DNA repair exonuclease SbcCD nuclease subunit
VIVFAADLHLKPTTWAKFPDLRRDAFISFGQVAAYCCAHKADALILGGDVFDSSTPNSNSVFVFKAGISLLENAGIPVYGIQGQHERSAPPWMSLTPHVKHLDGQSKEHRIWPVTCDDHVVAVRGIDNTSATRLKELLDADIADGEHYDILVLHQALRDMVYETAWDLADEWLPPFVHVVLLGDLHIAASKGKCHYSGSMSLQSISESPQKSFITVHCDSNGNLEVRRQPLKTRDMMKFAITDESSRDSAIDVLKSYEPSTDNPDLIRPLVVAYISTDVPSALAYISAVCEEKQMFLDIRDLRPADGAESSSTPQPEVVSMSDLVGECVEPMKFDRPEDKQELIDFAVRLLKSKDASGELVTIKKEMGVTTETG